LVNESSSNNSSYDDLIVEVEKRVLLPIGTGEGVVGEWVGLVTGGVGEGGVGEGGVGEGGVGVGGVGGGGGPSGFGKHCLYH